MKVKTGSTVILLAFVAVSVGYLIRSESKSARTGEVASGQGAAQILPEKEPVRANSEPATVASSAAAPSDPAAGPTQSAHKVIAYYFHTTQRCMTCNRIERLTEEALREQFAEPLEQGELEWRVVNMEEPLYTHFVQDYRLVASSLVLVDLHDGEQRDWTNMEKVWQYVHGDEARFKQYVAEQTRKYLES